MSPTVKTLTCWVRRLVYPSFWLMLRTFAQNILSRSRNRGSGSIVWLTMVGISGRRARTLCAVNDLRDGGALTRIGAVLLQPNVHACLPPSGARSSRRSARDRTTRRLGAVQLAFDIPNG